MAVKIHRIAAYAYEPYIFYKQVMHYGGDTDIDNFWHPWGV